MARNRLLVFARKPAPVQVTFAGYPGTTGLSTIDYRITDPYLDPPGLYDRLLLRGIDPPAGLLLVLRSARQRAGSQRPAGCGEGVYLLRVPQQLLQGQPARSEDLGAGPQGRRPWVHGAGSRLTILAGEGTHRQHALDLLAEEGVAGDRVTFVANQPRPQYLTYYHGMDIGLDTVPYNGHTTSLDSFWMGVPVVTLAGPTVVGRAGLSQLMNLGLPELIASSPEQYVHVAAELAHDLPRLSGLRATLRDRMQASPLMDAPRFARNLEAAYREMWRRWCA